MGSNQSQLRGESVVYIDEEIPNMSPILRNSRVYQENGGDLISTFRSIPEADTTAKILKSSAVKYANKDCLGEREVISPDNFGSYKWMNYHDFEEKVILFSKGLVLLGISPGDKVGIYSHNCPFWQISNYACHYSSFVSVPVYDSLGPNAAEYIITHSECKAVVVHKEKLKSFMTILPNLENIRTVIVIDSSIPETENKNVRFFTCDDIMEIGKEKAFALQEPSPDDLAIIMYTSGSTGNPKGCLLTHKNIVSGATGLGCLGASITKTDVYLSFLPLAHIYELGVELIMIAQGASIGFYSGNVKNLTNDLQALQPTIICGVPRVWNRIVDTMKAKIQALPKLKQLLINSSIKMKLKAIKSGKPHSEILDLVVFKSFISVLGGRVRLIVSGGAPILPEVYDFLRATITPNVVQGYGLTEVAAGLAVQEIPPLTPSDTGAVSITSDVKLRAVEGLQYNPRGSPMCGEILVRGPHVFKGYYKDEKQTNDCMVDGEWFATGDIGMITSSGVVQIIDRAKQLVKLSQGEYLSITSLTDLYGRAEGVQNIYIYADSHHDFPAALVIPTSSMIKEWSARGITDPVNSQSAKEDLIKNLNEIAKAQSLRGFEKITTVVIDLEEFTIENGLLTPSMKPQWQSLRKKYESSLIDAMESKK